MRLLINDHAGHAFPLQLSRSLASRGHNVLHTFTNNLQTPRGNLQNFPNDPDKFNISPLTLNRPFNRYSPIKRYLHEIQLGKLLENKLIKFQPDLVISSQTPLIAQRQLIKTCLGYSIGFIFWLQDILGIGIHSNLKKKLPGVGALIGNYFIRLEYKLLKQSSRVIAITEDFVPIVKSAGTKPSNIHVVENWAPLNKLPITEKQNKWSIAHKLNTTFNFIYTGTLGMKHNPELLVNLALAMKQYSEVRVVVISEGLGANFLEKQKQIKNLKNLFLFPFTAFSELPFVQGTADVLIAVLEPEAGVFAVPSKVLSYLCAKRPLLLAVPHENLSAKIVTENHAGIVVSPNDTNGFIENAIHLFGTPSARLEMASNGRKYAETNFDIEHITNKFEKIISDFQVGPLHRI